MWLPLEISGKEFFSLHMICPAIFIQELVIAGVVELGRDVVLDEIVEIGHGLGTHSVGTVDGAIDDVLPPQVVSCLCEVSAEILLK